MKLKPYVDNDIITVKPQQQVDILIASESPIGYRAIINSRHWGMLYKNQIFQKVNIGDRFEGYIRRNTDAYRIALTLRKEGYDGVAVSADALLKLIEENGGELSIGANSSPEKVHALTQMSKKVFKRAVGILLKRGVITTDGESITLKK